MKNKEADLTLLPGTVKWMAPEVLSKSAYTEKADVYRFPTLNRVIPSPPHLTDAPFCCVHSYAIILWELVTKKTPYDDFAWTHEIAPFVMSGKRLEIPEGIGCPPLFRSLMNSCWEQEPQERPEFSQIASTLESSLSETTTATTAVDNEAAVGANLSGVDVE